MTSAAREGPETSDGVLFRAVTIHCWEVSESPMADQCDVPHFDPLGKALLSMALSVESQA